MSDNIEKVKKMVWNIFSNIFLLSVKNRIDLLNIIPDVEYMIKEINSN